MSRPENDADEDTSLWAKAPKVARTYHKVPCVIAYRRRGGEVGGGGMAPVSPGGGGRGSARAPASGAKGALTP